MSKLSSSEVKVDGIFKGRGFGSVASELIANNMDPKTLRSNAVLGYDDWKMFDDAILQISTLRKGAVQDLISRGLVHNIGNTLGQTVLQYQDASDMEDAELTMDGLTKATQDRPEFDINLLPLPIIHTDFSYSSREINASRQSANSIPLDTTTAEIATRKVLEKAESILMTGASTYTFGGGSLYGYEDVPTRNTGTLSQGAWTSSSATGTTMLADVLAMIQESTDARHHGPWVLYVPTGYQTVLGEDFKANSDKSIKTRLLEVDGLEDIKINDFMSSTNIILVNMQSETVRMVQGLPVQMVQWDTDGGFRINFKVLTVLVPQIRADQADRSGIVDYSQ